MMYLSKLLNKALKKANLSL